MSLSYEESDYPIAIGNGRVVYFHRRETKPEKLDTDGYDITKDEADQIFDIIQSQKKGATFAHKHLRYYEDCKEEYLLGKGKSIILEPDHKGKTSEWQIIPKEIENQRQDICVSGPSGSGKSTWTSKYMKIYHQLNPKNKVIIFSKKTEDPAYDSFKFVKRIPLNDDFIDLELEPEDLKNTLCVFDDIENISKKEVKAAVYKLLNDVQETGRSMNINVILCNHVVMNGHSTKVSLNECDGMVFFESGSAKHRKNTLDTYVGLDKNQIEIVNNMLKKSRWVFINKSCPVYAVSETKIILL